MQRDSRVEWGCGDRFALLHADAPPAADPWRRGRDPFGLATTAGPQPNRQQGFRGAQRRGGAKRSSAEVNTVEKLAIDNVPEPETLHGPITVADNILTVMVKNIPCGCRQPGILQAIEELGFGLTYEFFYMPTRRNGENFGYAFVGFRDSETTAKFYQAMTGYCVNFRRNKKLVEVVPARIQGFRETYDHFKSTHAMRGKTPPIFVGTPAA